MQPKYNPHQAKRGHNLGTLDVSHSPAPSHPPRSSGRKVAKYSVCESSSVLSRACVVVKVTKVHTSYIVPRGWIGAELREEMLWMQSSRNDWSGGRIVRNTKRTRRAFEASLGTSLLQT